MSPNSLKVNENKEAIDVYKTSSSMDRTMEKVLA